MHTAKTMSTRDSKPAPGASARRDGIDDDGPPPNGASTRGTRRRRTPRTATVPTIECVPLESLTPLTDNPRQHSPRDLGYLEGVLQRVGAARSGVIDEAGVILAGNGFRAAALQAG